MTTEILDVVTRWADAERTGDTSAYDSLLTPDFTGIGPAGFTLTKHQWAARHSDLTNHHFEILDPSTRRYGDAAIVTAVQNQRTTARGHDASGSFRLTLLLVRSTDGWTIANLQLSGPLRPATISRAELQAAIGKVTIVDALPAPAYERRHLPTAINLTAEDAPAKAATLLPDRTAPIVIYSTDPTCTRAPDLANALTTLGYQNLRLYTEGIEAWSTAALPLEP
ncbi:nuclear transport factor 2 family protein [Actinomadura sp. NTSP31]|uniref:nuclear transport factor 2 family protein n=1 Tax=Actinomadura sp. NTSP31 TaxID=1735447 RepID=UPI0035BEB732